MKVDSSKPDNQVQNNQQTKYSKPGEQSSILNSEKTNYLQKDFETILRNTTDQNENLYENKSVKKTSENEETQKNEETNSKLTDKNKEKNLEEKQNKSNSEDSKSDTNLDKSSGYIQIISQTNPKQINYPNARTILHIADLERIISSIRSQTFSTGKQITIELKRSVFQGLEIKLTIDKNRKVIAEFIAANENVKNQLNEKAEEIAGLLKDRGVKLAELTMSLNSDSNSNNYQDSNETYQLLSFDKSINDNDKSETNDLDINESAEDSDTSYQV